MEFISKKEEETAKIAKDFGSKIEPKNYRAYVVGLYGDLGAGKTTFMKYLAEHFGVSETIQSPTFVIEKIYELTGQKFTHLIHIDAYRIEKETEMVDLGWNEVVSDNKNIICVEWPEKMPTIMPPHTKIFFEHISENERKIDIKES